MLEDECQASGVQIFTNTAVKEIKHDSEFEVGEFRAPALGRCERRPVDPENGRDGNRLRYRAPVRPQDQWSAVRLLVPLTFSAADVRSVTAIWPGFPVGRSSSVDGQRLPREAADHAPRLERTGAFCRCSSYWRSCAAVEIDLAPGRCEVAPVYPASDAGRPARRFCVEFLPNRLADRWLELNCPEAWTNAALSEFENALHAWRVSFPPLLKATKKPR